MYALSENPLSSGHSEALLLSLKILQLETDPPAGFCRLLSAELTGGGANARVVTAWDDIGSCMIDRLDRLSLRS